MNAPPRKRFALRIAHLPAFARLIGAVVVGAIAGLALPHSWQSSVRLVASWDGFALTALALTWFTIIALKPEHIRHVAQMEDPSRSVSLAVVVLGASASLFSVAVLLQSSMSMQRESKTWAIVLALSAVVQSWVLIQTVFTLRYAHLYYGTDDKPGGLEFPGGDDCPEYLDFAYFAFVIGMTAQTADIGVVSREMRRNVLLHGVIAFWFNTAVLALSIGVLTTLL